MQEPKDSLATHSQRQTSEQPVSSSEAIRQFLVKAGEVYGKQITSPLVSIWIEALSDYPADKLAHSFRQVFRTFKADYGKTFPTPADVAEPIKAVTAAAAFEGANVWWQKVLEIRRRYFNPDMPGHLSTAVATLPERVQRAVRASGVFREVSDLDQLHVWAKKAFLDSYARWEEIEESQFLLPEGSEIKALLTDVAERRALPAPKAIQYPYTPTIAAARKEEAAEKRTVHAKTERVTVTVSDEAREALRRQAKTIRERYSQSGDIRGIPSEFLENPGGVQ